MFNPTVPPLGVKEGCVFTEYEHLSDIGVGNFSTVCRARSKRNGTIVAIKSCPKSDPKKLYALRKEWEALSSIKHESIVAVHEYYEDASTASLVLECAEFGSLMSFLQQRAVKERQVRDVVRQLLSALEYLHQTGLAHRDVKPHNVLVVSDDPVTVRLADFGLVTPCGWCRMNSAGDWDIMAPEVKDNMDERRPLTAEEFRKNDIFAVGVTMFYLLSGRPPFPRGVDCRMQPDYPWNQPMGDVSADAVVVVKRLMSNYLDERPEAIEALGLDWFTHPPQRRSPIPEMGNACMLIQPPSAVDGTSPGGAGRDVGSASPLLARHDTSVTEESFELHPSNETMGVLAREGSLAANSLEANNPSMPEGRRHSSSSVVVVTT